MAQATLGAGDVRRRFENVIDVLRYHVATGRFGYVDRIMAAMDPAVVEETVREAVRAALSAASSPRVIEGYLLEYDKEKKSWEPKPEKTKVEYVEDERLRPGSAIPTRARLHGKLLQVGNEWRITYTPPRIPSEKELAEFFDAVRKDLNVAKLVASLAMTLESRG
jgi:CRISPR type I-A-associated protein Csa5